MLVESVILPILCNETIINFLSMKNHFLFILAVVLSLSACSDSKEAFDKIAKEVKGQFVPDSRDRVFEARLDDNNGTFVLRGATTEQDAKEALVAQLKKAGINALDSMEVLPSAELGDKTYGIAALSVLNLRMGPDYDAESGTQVLMGMPLLILENRGGWLRVITPEGYIAWVTEKSVKAVTKEESETWKASPKYIVTTYYTILREQPDENSEVVSDAVWCDLVAQTGEQAGNYYKVLLPNGKNAFLLKKDAMDFNKWIESRTPDAESIISTAKQFLGFPYMWGGTSVKAMDCSGFSKTTFLLNGIILKRDASQQAYTGDDIDISGGLDNLKTGDLIFFGRKATPEKKERVSHVGIYIGNGEFIHCATYVRINSLIEGTPNYYEGSTRLIRAQRILGTQDSGKGVTSVAKHPWYF